MPLRVETSDNIGVILQDVNLLNELLLLLNIARSSSSVPWTRGNLLIIRNEASLIELLPVVETLRLIRQSPDQASVLKESEGLSIPMFVMKSLPHTYSLIY